MYVNVVLVKLFVQGSEFNMCWRIALYKDCLLLLLENENGNNQIDFDILVCVQFDTPVCVHIATLVCVHLLNQVS